MKIISDTEYHQCRRQDAGFCTVCQDFTRYGVEPDAEGYECPECEGNTVFGTEQARLLGFLYVEN